MNENLKLVFLVVGGLALTLVVAYVLYVFLPTILPVDQAGNVMGTPQIYWPGW